MIQKGPVPGGRPFTGRLGQGATLHGPVRPGGDPSRAGSGRGRPFTGRFGGTTLHGPVRAGDDPSRAGSGDDPSRAGSGGRPCMGLLFFATAFRTIEHLSMVYSSTSTPPLRFRGKTITK